MSFPSKHADSQLCKRLPKGKAEDAEGFWIFEALKFKCTFITLWGVPLQRSTWGLLSNMFVFVPVKVVKLVGALEHCWFFHKLGIMIPTHYIIFLKELKPPIRKDINICSASQISRVRRFSEPVWFAALLSRSFSSHEVSIGRIYDRLIKVSHNMVLETWQFWRVQIFDIHCGRSEERPMIS